MISTVPGMAARTPGQRHARHDRPALEDLDLRQQQGAAQHLQPDQHGGRHEINQSHPEPGRVVEAERSGHRHDDGETQDPGKLTGDRAEVGHFAHRETMIRQFAKNASLSAQQRWLGMEAPAMVGHALRLPDRREHPAWVWPLMLFVLWLGWRGLQPRVMPPARLAILPLISLAHRWRASHSWAVALIVALPLG